jgi:hypothetical protein
MCYLKKRNEEISEYPRTMPMASRLRSKREPMSGSWWFGPLVVLIGLGWMPMLFFTVVHPAFGVVGIVWLLFVGLWICMLSAM